MSQTTYQQLSKSRQRLVRQLQKINFGRIERLVIKDGEPVFDPQPEAVKEIKFGGDNGPRPESSEVDFALKAQVLDLLEQIDDISNGVIDLIEIKHGLPFRMLVKA